MRTVSAGQQASRTLLLLCLLAPALHGQATHVKTSAEASEHLRSHVFVYDLRTGTSHEIYTADSIWEAPNWSPDGKYLIANSGDAIYKLTLKPDGTAEPQKLSIPDNYRCNNDKALSPDGTKLAFSATVSPAKGSQVFLAEANGTNIQRMTQEWPSYFHGWSPDHKMLAFVAQRNNSGQFDIYRIPASGGTEQRLTSNVHHDDGPDYSPDGKWIYINSDRSGKEAVWRFPADGAGPNDVKAENVVSDSLEDWFPHISPDGTKMVYIGYPGGTPTHNPRDVRIALKLVAINHNKVATTQKTLVEGVGGQGSMNVNSWAPDSMRFAYVTYEAIP
jgi:Tol biopolymer transport system component